MVAFDLLSESTDRADTLALTFWRKGELEQRGEFGPNYSATKEFLGFVQGRRRLRRQEQGLCGFYVVIEDADHYNDG